MTVGMALTMWTPRVRGWTHTGAALFAARAVDPARAGMDPIPSLTAT